MRIRNIDKTIPGGPLLEIEIDAGVSNIVDFPYAIDIAPIDDVAKRSSNRSQRLNSHLDDLEINDDDIRRAITEQVEGSHVNIIRFYRIEDG